MMTSSNGNISALLVLCEGNPPATGGFPSQMPVTRCFDVFFDLRLNKRLNKQSRRRRFETPLHSLWRHCNIISFYIGSHYEDQVGHPSFYPTFPERYFLNMHLTHWGRVTHICVRDLTTIGSDNGLNQCSNIVNWTFRTNLQWNLNRISFIFIQENVFENVCKMASISSRSQCFNILCLFYGKWDIRFYLTCSQLWTCVPESRYQEQGQVITSYSVCRVLSLVPALGTCSRQISPQLTHWGRDSMAAISQTTHSNPFSWMKIFEFRLKFDWSLFPRVKLTIFQHWFG